MDSENGHTIDDKSSGTVLENTTIEDSVPDLKTEGENIGSDEANDKINFEHVTEPEVPNSSGVALETSAIPTASKTSKNVKGRATLNGGISKSSKMVKEKPNLKNTTLTQNRRSVLSQSLSFPARGVRDDMKKSIDGYLVKTNFKHAQASGNKSEFPFANGSVNHPNRRASAGMTSKEANTGSNGSAQLSSIHSLRRPVVLKSEVSLLVDQNSKPVKSALPIKEEDDAHSTASGGRRSSISGFASRLDERAEKRKEFYSELEKKIQAKEAEKTNLQEKSKENQEAEIKQLRKNMAFRATPMPSFYKETLPKIELKKIPTTRPISPKLGRQKTFVAAATNNSSEGSPRSCLSPHLNREQNNSAKALNAKGDKDTKKLTRKSQPRFQSQEAASPKKAVKPIISKRKTMEAETQNQETCTRRNEESQNQSAQLPEHEDRKDTETDMNPAHNDAPILTSLAPEIMSHEVAVGG